MASQQNKFLSQRSKDSGAGKGRVDISKIDPPNEDDVQVLTEAVIAQLDEERLHVPVQIEEERVDLPFDLTELSDIGLQKLYSAFSAYSYRAGYLLMLEETKESKCREAADEIVTAYLANAEGDEGSVTSIKAKAEQVPAVKGWRKLQRHYGTLANALRKERDSYDKKCERLSRLETMRMNEFERAGQKITARASASKPKPKAK